jgi:hypothetical protein
MILLYKILTIYLYNKTYFIDYTNFIKNTSLKYYYCFIKITRSVTIKLIGASLLTVNGAVNV